MINVLKIGNGYVSPNRKEFVIDSVADVAGLPTKDKKGVGVGGYCDPGSIAYTPDFENIFMLGNDNVWHESKING